MMRDDNKQDNNNKQEGGRLIDGYWMQKLLCFTMFIRLFYKNTEMTETTAKQRLKFLKLGKSDRFF